MIRKSSGHFALPKTDEQVFRDFNKHHDLTSDPLISEWMDDLMTRRQGRLDCVQLKQYVTHVK